ncbi:MAG: hypothetical protein H6718_07740 [Polyangiaceae bacterium]|nr:hypothetical protein [Polyangiaceae bacterium]
MALLLEQYKMAVDSSLRVTEWRYRANQFGLAAVGGMLAAFGWVVKAAGESARWPLVAACIFGVVFALYWLQTIRSHRQLNSAKFKIIHQIEVRFPVRFFAAEWELVKLSTGTARYRSFSRLDEALVIIICLLFGVLAMYFGSADSWFGRNDVGGRAGVSSATEP